MRIVNRHGNRRPMQDYLEHNQDPILVQHLAQNSRLPNSPLNNYHSYTGVFRRSNGTSMILSGDSQTRETVTSSRDLAALTSTASSRTDNVYATTSLGERELAYQQRLESPTEGAALEIPTSVRLPLLECPFNIIHRCLMDFVDFEEWLKHSLLHFGTVGPPKENQCCFSYTCPARFQGQTGNESWRRRMVHIYYHHQSGSRLATAQPDFGLIYYMYCNRLIKDPEYRDLKASYEQRSRTIVPPGAAQAYPSPPDSPDEPPIAHVLGPYTETEGRRHRPRR